MTEIAGTEPIDTNADILDSRDIEARIAWLGADDGSGASFTDDAAEYNALVEFRDELSGYLADWQYGEALIRDDHFTEYTRELLKDVGYIPRDFPSWIEIDWEKTAENVRQDYTSAELDGTTYWGRS
jgi:hypothetical protein